MEPLIRGRDTAILRTVLAVSMAIGAALFALYLHGVAKDPVQITPLASTTNLHLSDVASTAGGTAIDLSSFTAAAKSIATSDVRINWPGATGLGDNTMNGASITVSVPSQSIVLEGSMTIDTSSLSAMLILRWTGSEPTPTISLGIKGTLDMTMLNPNWKLEGGAFTVDGFIGVSTGEQDLTDVPGAATFYAGRTSLPAAIEIQGSMALSNLLPGIGANASVQIGVSATLDADIGALLTPKPLTPADPGKATFTGTILASNLALPHLSLSLIHI